ncbi:MAG: BadF/BadG/BcrA/BcrD ATPase family protein [Gluconobacter japonicus]|uniref:N-acetylglucosamine kinase n=1 Tax=Gluconobacter japonicus TaxID=376620 RepID=UPI0039EA01CF
MAPESFAVTEPCIAAIDGGGSKTLLVVLNSDGTIANVEQTGGTNPFDQPLWRERLTGLLKLLPNSTQAVGLGLAGYGESATLCARQEDAVSESLGKIPYSLTNDVDMACSAAFGGEPGVLVLSGTGSMAWASDGRGQHCRVGGWGSLFGDEGSAYQIGRNALTLLTHILDGRNTRDFAFLEPFCMAMGLPSDPKLCTPALLEWYGNLEHPRSAVAALARHVSTLAENGCTPAAALLNTAATELAVHIRAARTKMPDVELPWSYAGGTLQSPFLRNAIAAQCGTPVSPLLPPIGGGLLTAARQAGWTPDASWITSLARTLGAAGLGS